MTAGAILSSFSPAPEPSTAYVDADFSADGSSLFITGSPAGGDSNLYIMDRETGALLKEIKHISMKAGGVQRVELKKARSQRSTFFRWSGARCRLWNSPLQRNSIFVLTRLFPDGSTVRFLIRYL